MYHIVVIFGQFGKCDTNEILCPISDKALCERKVELGFLNQFPYQSCILKKNKDKLTLLFSFNFCLNVFTKKKVIFFLN